MSKHKNIKPIVVTAEQQFDMGKPRFNAHQTGHGAHKNAKAYTRKRKHNGRDWE